MYNPPGDPRTPSGPHPHGPHGFGASSPQPSPPAYGQAPQQQYGQAVPSPYGQAAPSPYGQASQQQQYGQAVPSPHGQAAPSSYGQSSPPSPYGQVAQQPGQYGQGSAAPYGAQPQHGQAQPPYGQPPQPQAYGQSAPPPYGAPPPPSFGSPAPSFGSPAPSAPPQTPSYGGLPGLGRMGGVANMGLGRAAAALPQVSGMPPVVAFGLGIVAVVVALVFDIIFLKVHIPGVGGYAWYLTTALSFAGAGYFGIKWTRASQSTAMAAVALAGVLYGLADIGLGVVLEDLPMGSAMFLGIQGLVIACVCGGGGVRKALGERDDD